MAESSGKWLSWQTILPATFFSADASYTVGQAVFGNYLQPSYERPIVLELKTSYVAEGVDKYLLQHIVHTYFSSRIGWNPWFNVTLESWKQIQEHLLQSSRVTSDSGGNDSVVGG
jgi:hypothetical protein